MKFRCGIKIIFTVLLALPAAQWASDWEAGISGNYSLATRTIPPMTYYALPATDTHFIDFGGRIAHRLGPGYLGLNTGLYSSFGLRQEVPGTAMAVPSFLSTKSAEVGSSLYFNGGTYRLALGWSAAQLRYRLYFLDELFFVEAGSGPAYGFGAIEVTLKGSNGTADYNSVTYHRYAEWGAISALAVGFSFPPGNGLRIDFLLEGAWLWALIRNPDISQTDTFLLSQFFFRPTVGLTFRF